MLKIIIPTIMLIPTTWLTPAKWLWPAILAHSLSIALVSTTWLMRLTETGWSFLGSYMATDPISTPLLMLTCWLLPLMILASQNHLALEPVNRQRTYISLLISLQFFLIIAFSATEMAMFYIAFEATLIPTLVIITRWGNQAERLSAGIYFLFYTLTASLPLLIALLVLQHHTGSLSILTAQYPHPIHHMSYTNKLWWSGFMLAFLVKLPLYGVHLWLPKAHVEAPVAGSMILAAVLLKLGGYGMMRMVAILDPLTKELSYPFIIFALWGLIMTGSTCLRQADLKSMIAYSSVAHMGLVVGGILIQTQWSFTGALILMVAHGLTSSALFCLANTNYERTHSRVMLLTRGLQMALPLMTAWWFLSTLANLALPPSPNLMAELMLVAALCNWSPRTLVLTGAGILITAAYSLYMFLTTQRGRLPPHIKALDPSHSREHLVVTLHLTPILLLILKPELIWTWFT
uniref:NADH-ubiquinone oxidoreductase chain 4 n=1 Tax=Lates japonicus TaxID=270547 RepID=A0A1V1FJB3_LATJO|nr:NADH dehydrogenase subunit 4 [Lates japonicus]ASR74920.1 NADH dehydrogenase subunit 4 [Lates japonicus]BAX03808.1 NADH dehydrogenase subunit 4 [Lates japonicus]BBU25783.1 NADH dehydrogenase subunit 4 [Lates japonicus]